MPQSADVVIVGGGFAGTTLVQELQRRNPLGVRVVLLSEESYTTFNPMLAEVVGAAVFPEHVVAPIRQMLRSGSDTQFVMARVTGADFERREVSAESLAGPLAIGYRHLVLAFGSRANLDLVPGMARHALPLKLVGDAMHIRNQVLRRVARIELETDPALRRRLGHFVVIGGGFSGVEVAGAVADFLRTARRYYPRVRDGELAVTLIEGGAGLLAELPASLGEAAMRSLRARGIDVRLQARAARVDGDGVHLVDGGFIGASTVICTIGTRPNPLVQRLQLPMERGRIAVGADMAVDGRPGVWALGDCALVPNQASGGASPPTAQFAVAQARALARNLGAADMGRTPRPFAHRSRGMMATTGHLKGVALLLGVRLRGLPAWLMWRAYYLSLMPTFGRKLRIWVEWTWGMVFAADITHFRFERTHEADTKSTSNPLIQES
jgi:NADH:ubiquinone reductase (H+-translocating)